MNEEAIKELISNEVEKQLLVEKKKLAQIIENKLLYAGEYAGARKLMDAINEWAW